MAQAPYKELLRAWKHGASDRASPGEGGESPDAVVQRGLEGLRALGLYQREKRGPPSVRSEGSSEGGVAGGAANGAATHGRHVCVVAHSRFNKLLIGGLSGDVSQAAKVAQGNACVNVIDFPVGGGTCNVVRLNVCDHLLSHSQTRVASGGEGGSAKSDSEKWF